MPTMFLAAAPSNPILPNGTFIAELIAFILMLVVLGKWVVPPINRALSDRQEKIRKQFAELDEAKARAQAAEDEYRAQLSQARHEARRIREEAKEEGAKFKAEMRAEAQAEYDRILKHAQSQLEASRQQVIQQLRTELGNMATELAGRIVGESLDDDARRARTVERFIDSIEASSTSSPSGVR